MGPVQSKPLNIRDSPEKLLNSYLSQLRSSPSSYGEKPFPQALGEAISLRNQLIESIEQVLRRRVVSAEILNHEKMSSAFKFANNVKRSPVRIAVVGPGGSGKSMLVSELISRQVVLPSMDETTTARITRLVHSEESVLKVIETDWDLWEKDFEEYPTHIGELNEEKLLKRIYLPVDKREDDRFVTSIVEIGIPSDILKQNVQILDCPGIDQNEVLSKRQRNILRQVNPSIVCYVFDHNKGFSMKDGEKLDALNIELAGNTAHCVQYLLIENKIDEFNENEFDHSISEERNSGRTFDRSESIRNVRDNCLFTQSNRRYGDHNWFRFDKDRVVTVLPLSTGMLYFQKLRQIDEEYKKMFLEVQGQIVRKILEQPLPIIDIYCFYMALSDKKSMANIGLWFKLKSIAINPKLIDFIKLECEKEENILLNFTKGFVVYRLVYNDKQIQVTTISKMSEFPKIYSTEKRRIYQERFDRNDARDALVYECAESNRVYLIDKEMPHDRLLDKLCDLELPDVMLIIKQIVDINIQVEDIKPNFRADNIYITADRKIRVNNNIPNHSNLPFFVSKRRALHNVVHIHSTVRDLGRFGDKWWLTDKLTILEFLYSFGWTLWILLCGDAGFTIYHASRKSVAERISLLRRGRFPNYPRYLDNILIKCWNISGEDSSLWEPISTQIMSNWWLQEKEARISTEFIYLMTSGRRNSQCTQIDGKIRDCKSFELIYQGDSFHISVISSSNESELQEVKDKLYRMRKYDHNLLLYENEFTIYVIDKKLSS